MYEAAQASDEEMIADFVAGIRRGDLLSLEWSEGTGTSLPGSRLAMKMADILEDRIGIRRVQNSNGSTTIVKLKPKP